MPRYAAAGGSTLLLFASRVVVFKHRRLLRETDSSRSGQSGAIIQEEFMTTVRHVKPCDISLRATVHAEYSL